MKTSKKYFTDSLKIGLGICLNQVVLPSQAREPKFGPLSPYNNQLWWRGLAVLRKWALVDLWGLLASQPSPGEFQASETCTLKKYGGAGRSGARL